MSTETVDAEWVSDRVFVLRDHNQFPLVMTQPNGVAGADLLPLSLIGCAAWDVLDILQKQRQNVTGMRVSAASERDPEPPWRFRAIHVTYHLEGHGLSKDKTRRAIALSEEKFCSIFATLRDAVALTSGFELIEAP